MADDCYVLDLSCVDGHYDPDLEVGNWGSPVDTSTGSTAPILNACGSSSLKKHKYFEEQSFIEKKGSWNRNDFSRVTNIPISHLEDPQAQLGSDAAVVSDGDCTEEGSLTDLSSVNTEETGGVDSDVNSTTWVQAQINLQQKDIRRGKLPILPKGNIPGEKPMELVESSKINTRKAKSKPRGPYSNDPKVPLPRYILYELPDDFVRQDRNLKEAIYPKKPHLPKKEDYTKVPHLCRMCGQPRLGHLCFVTKVRLNIIPSILVHLPVEAREKLMLYLDRMDDQIKERIGLGTAGSAKSVLPTVEAKESFASEPTHAMDSLAATDGSTSPKKRRRMV